MIWKLNLKLNRLLSAALPVFLLVYGLASLVHFIHNAEFLADYPGLPPTWTRAGVYGVWLGMSAVGVLAWTLWRQGWQRLGLTTALLYASFGLDSLGHYWLAPVGAHSLAMNATILAEVATAAGVFVTSAWLLLSRKSV